MQKLVGTMFARILGRIFYTDILQKSERLYEFSNIVNISMTLISLNNTQYK